MQMLFIVFKTHPLGLLILATELNSILPDSLWEVHAQQITKLIYKAHFIKNVVPLKEKVLAPPETKLYPMHIYKKDWSTILVILIKLIYIGPGKYETNS